MLCGEAGGVGAHPEEAGQPQPNLHLHLYTDIQSVLAIMANASVAMGLESVVESWVSTMEHHSSPRRPLTQDRLEQECMVAINGPMEVQCDSVITYWARQTSGATPSPRQWPGSSTCRPPCPSWRNKEYNNFWVYEFYVYVSERNIYVKFVEYIY